MTPKKAPTRYVDEVQVEPEVGINSIAEPTKVEPAIPYDMIVPSASRPHLLENVLESYFTYADQKPRRLIVHDDAAFPNKGRAVEEIVQRVAYQADIPYVFQHDNPPLNHGPSIAWLLNVSETEFLMYSQDDHIVVRDLPVRDALQVMYEHKLNHVRFNKRPTMEYKATFKKKRVDYTLADGRVFPLCVSDHWYFQTSLWRRSVISTVVAWYMANTESFHEHCEAKVNKALNRDVPEFNWAWKRGAFGDRILLPPSQSECMEPDIREVHQKTFIWGPPGEDKYVFHIGDDPKDWALWRPRGGVGIRDTQ